VPPESVPGKLVDEAMILMGVERTVGQNEVGLDLALEQLESLLDRITLVGKVTVSKVPYDNLACRGLLEKARGASLRLKRAFTNRAENHPVDGRLRVLTEKAENRPASSDLYVVGMSAKAEKVI
jgi:hypothetical protein